MGKKLNIKYIFLAIIVLVLLLIIIPFIWEKLGFKISPYINVIIILVYVILIVIILNFPKIIQWVKEKFSFEDNSSSNINYENDLKKSLALTRSIKKLSYRHLKQRTMIISDTDFNQNKWFNPPKGIQLSRLGNYYEKEESQEGEYIVKAKSEYNLLDNIRYFFCFEKYAPTTSFVKYKSDILTSFYYDKHILIHYKLPVERQNECEWYQLIEKINQKYLNRGKDSIVLMISESSVDKDNNILKKTIEILVENNSNKKPIYLVITQIKDLKIFSDELTKNIQNFDNQVIGALNYNWIKKNIMKFPDQAIEKICDEIKNYLIYTLKPDNVHEQLSVARKIDNLALKINKFCNEHFGKNVHVIRGIYFTSST